MLCFCIFCSLLSQRSRWTWRISPSTMTTVSPTATRCMRPSSPVVESSTRRTTSGTERWWGCIHNHTSERCFTSTFALGKLQKSHPWLVYLWSTINMPCMSSTRLFVTSMLFVLHISSHSVSFLYGHINNIYPKHCFILYSFKVFVDKHFVGVLDYKVQEIALPDGKVPC